MRNLFGTLKQTPKQPSNLRSYQPNLETLESRIVPYGATGFDWPHPEMISISFVPDGTNLGGVTSNLQATLTAKFGSAKAWQNIILKAAQTWAAQTNINFTLVTDNGAASGSGDYQQGDPNFGDIRIGGYNFKNSQTLAAANFSPSANNYSVGGDVTFNTGVPWNAGSDYDLYTVAVHEIGHSLGLDHSSTSSAVMYSAYTGAKTTVATDDINGIRSIYGGVRTVDAYDTTSNGTFATADAVAINDATNTALVTNLDISTSADLDFYKFTAPSDTTSTLKLTIQSSGLSLFAAKVWVYNSAQTQLATATGLSGSTITLTVSGMVAGKTYYVKVDGADATVFGIGKYAMTLNLGTGAAPTVSLPDTMTENGTPLHCSGGVANRSMLGELLVPLDPVLNPLSFLTNPLLGFLGPVVNPLLVTVNSLTSPLTEGIFGGYGDTLEASRDAGAADGGAGHSGGDAWSDAGSLFGASPAGNQFLGMATFSPDLFAPPQGARARAERHSASSHTSSIKIDGVFTASNAAKNQDEPHLGGWLNAFFGKKWA